MLANFQLHPQDIGPTLVSNICNFQVFCEVYLQGEPTAELFRDFFHLNRRTEFVNGPNTELGGVSIQKRKEVEFLMPNCTAILRNGTRLGFTAEILLLKMKIPFHAIMITGFPTPILCRNA